MMSKDVRWSMLNLGFLDYFIPKSDMAIKGQWFLMSSHT